MRALTLLASCVAFVVTSVAFGQSRADWSVSLDPSDARQGESARLLIKATIAEGWWVYGMKVKGGPRPIAISLAPGPTLTAQGPAIEPKTHTKFDPNFKMQVEYHTGTAVFALPVKVTAPAGPAKAKVNVAWQVCDKTVCELPSQKELEVSFSVAKGDPRPDRTTPLTSVPEQPKQAASGNKTSGSADDFASNFQQARAKGLISLILFAFGAGLLALLTPCVFPMIPITVSFFSKSSGAGKKVNYSGAAAYCAGIVGTFTALGLAVALIFGASGVQDIGASPWVNLFLVILFVALALSLFGAYEIVLPSGLVNRFGAKSRGSSVLTPMFMGLTFTVTSFTCTLPFVGMVLAGAATTGEMLYPAVGMLAFSLAFALPFFLLALFPQALSKLPKSGSWLSTVKASMGFLEIAAALKFLSNVDQVWETRWISEPVFLAIWAAIAFFASVYLFGWMRFKHERGEYRIGWPRRGFALAMAAAGVYCLAAIDGAPLGKLSAFLPPGKDKLEWLPKYEQALTLAAAQGKPIIIDFTGVTCTNCRDMEKNMFPRTLVNRELEGFVRAKLFTDRSNPNDVFNRGLLQKLTNSVTLPVYVIQSPEGKTLKVFQGSTNDEGAYLSFLRKGKEAFRAGSSGSVASRVSP